MPYVRPTMVDHVVYRTRRFGKMLEWYQTVFEARVQFQNPALAFLTFDDEHHRLALAKTMQWVKQRYGSRLCTLVNAPPGLKRSPRTERFPGEQVNSIDPFRFSACGNLVERSNTCLFSGPTVN